MMFQWQRYHIIDEMKRHDCQIEIISPLAYNTIELANEEIISKMSSGNYDMFMTCLTEQHLYKSTITRIKKYGFPTLLFCPDNLVAPYNHKTIAPLFDLVWLTSIETEYLFKRWNCKTLFLPYAANPYFLVPTMCNEEVMRVGFIGTPHGSRIMRINELLENKVPVTIHTRKENLSSDDSTFFKASLHDYAKNFIDFARYPIGRKLAKAAIIDKLSKRKILDIYNCLEVKDAVPLENLAELNGKYSLVLSFTDANSTGVLKNPVKIVNLRNFEIPMSGAIQFALYSDELASYFENDKEIVMGHTVQELVEKANYYLREDKQEIRKHIRLAARKRAENDHTWYNRFSRVFTELGIQQ